MESRLTQKIVAWTAFGQFLSFAAFGAPSAKEIAKFVIERDQGSTSYSNSTLTTCNFSENGTQRRCSTPPRKKVFEVVSKGQNKDVRTLSIVLEPAKEKGVSFLQQDYAAEDKESEQWIYMPRFKKPKRIVQNGTGSESGTLFGSEVAYEDLEKKRIKDYTFEMKKEDEISGKKTWVLEVIPTNERLTKSAYSKSELWVDQESHIPLKTLLYDKTGNLIKSIYSQSLQKQNNVWTARRMIVVNHQKRRMSQLTIQKVAFNIDIPDSLLQTRALDDRNFREQNLSKIRSLAK